MRDAQSPIPDPRSLIPDPQCAVCAGRFGYSLRQVKFSYEEFDLSGVKTYPLASRRSKANAADFATPFKSGSGVSGLIDSLPNFLAAADFKAVVAAMRAARDQGHGIIWGIGAHVLKTGLSPVLI